MTPTTFLEKTLSGSFPPHTYEDAPFGYDAILHVHRPKPYFRADAYWKAPFGLSFPVR